MRYNYASHFKDPDFFRAKICDIELVKNESVETWREIERAPAIIISNNKDGNKSYTDNGSQISTLRKLSQSKRTWNESQDVN